ncbi:MAG TPA: UDP-N-acetylmuramoylalanyl-D-glutamyl-2,6-diaminopimelate--D-alanyl-D-alanine ligase [Xanthobacteraceae bacterium]|nr:UDP-N-acetylmuramoylalanyl-D-glutamyl-2,6-diaminopimelate--D-alanyl-D-alanine ligase [Xanthobacteraceae bacterium]
MSDRALWAVDDMTATMRARAVGALPPMVSGLSIDSRTVGRGEAFFAIAGERHDGHDFVPAALANGAVLAVVATDRRARMPDDAPLLVVPDVLGGLTDLARAARARSCAQVVAVTGSVGKTGTKEALRLVLSTQGPTHASVASFNNHWGVPLSAARLPASDRFAVFELGMNHAGEITPLTRLVRPHVAIVTTVEPVHLAFFASVEDIADAKAEIFLGVDPGGAAVINRDNRYFERLRGRAAEAGIDRIVGFGADPRAEARLIDAALEVGGSAVRASILGTDVTYQLGSPGRHVVLNSLAVLAAAALVGCDLAVAARALAGLQPASGRGQRIVLDVPGGTALLIDESYNANPASMRAALALLGQVPVGWRGRRIAVLGDMLELGTRAPELHAGLAEPIQTEAVDVVFCAGPLMTALWRALPSDRQGGYAEAASGLEAGLLGVIRGGDVIMIKGSLGSRMGPLVKALINHFPRHEAAAQAASQG